MEHFLNNHSEDKFELVVQLELNGEVLVVVLVTGAALKDKCNLLIYYFSCPRVIKRIVLIVIKHYASNSLNFILHYNVL